MPLTITVRLRHGRYDAGGDPPGTAEWPPHPARVFCALAAAEDTGAAWAALRWLEAQPAPEIWADPPDRVHRGRTATYVVKNAVHPKGGGSISWPGRDNGMRTRAFATPATGSFAMVWPDADPPAGILAELGQMARLVAYVGRSTSLAEVTVSGSVPATFHGRVVYEPVQLGDPRKVHRVRVPYPGYADELRAAYLEDRWSWEVARAVPYAMRRQAVPAERSSSPGSGVQGPFEDLMVWALERPVSRINGDQLVTMASALRRAVLSRISDPIPAQISGHGAPGRPHVGFLALPDVDHDHADGHLLGLALAIPRHLAPEDLATLIRAVIIDPLSQLHLPGGRVLRLRYGADRSALQPARWAARSRGGAREWVTATPLMLDGHLRRGRDEASEVARSLEIAGYPRPADIDVSAAPLTGGAVWRPRQGTLPDNRVHRRIVHARVAFAEPVTGPVLAGSMRYLGLGLFLPVSPAARPTRGTAPHAHHLMNGQAGMAEHVQDLTQAAP
jgi:CRISPR-associated protein Csb2